MKSTGTDRSQSPSMGRITLLWVVFTTFIKEQAFNIFAFFVEQFLLLTPVINLSFFVDVYIKLFPQTHPVAVLTLALAEEKGSVAISLFDLSKPHQFSLVPFLPHHVGVYIVVSISIYSMILKANDSIVALSKHGS